MHRLFLTITALALALIAFPITEFRHITVNDGLSRNSIYSMLQDSTGMCYIGTWDALHRYDGHEVRELLFTPSAESPTRMITCMTQGTDKKIYAGTSKGILVWDCATEIATDLLPDTLSDYIRQILADRLENIHIRTGGDLHYVYSPTGDSLQKLPQSAELLMLDKNGMISALNATDFTELQQGVRIIAAMPGPDGELWVATSNSKVYHRPDADSPLNLMFPDGKLPQVRKFAKRGDAIIMATSRGLWIYSSGEPLEICRESLSDTDITDLMTDREGGLWVGSFFGGVNYLAPGKSNFTDMEHVNDMIDGHVISGIARHKSGELWFAVEDGGISRYYPSSGIITNYNSRKPGTFRPSVDNVQSIFINGDSLLVGTAHGGMDIFSISAAKRIAHYPPSGSASDFPRSVYAFANGPHGQIYIGTMSGLFCMHQGGEPQRVTEVAKEIIHALASDSHRNTWLASQGAGVYRLEASSGKWTHYTDPRINMAMSVCAPDSITYVGTEGHGLFRLDPMSGRVDSVALGMEEDRLMVFAIVADRANLWLTTNRGLLAYDRISGHTIRYTTSDGLRSNQFKINSWLTLPDGSIIVGGVNGFNRFNPTEIEAINVPPKALFADFSVSDKSIKLPGNVNYIDKIVLPQDANSFSVRFASSSFADPSKNRFEYMLSPLDTGWIAATPTNPLTAYSNLSAGNYTLHLRAYNGFGIPGPERLLHITVHPHWWLSAPMKIIYVLITIITILAIAFLIIHRHRKAAGQSSDTHSSSKTDISESDKVFLEQFNSIIDREIGNVDLAVNDIATEMNFGRSVFFRKVKDITGQTPNEYLRTLRLNRAAELLRQPNMRISQVCYMVGFSSPSYFTKRFTDRFGISPSEYMQQS